MHNDIICIPQHRLEILGDFIEVGRIMDNILRIDLAPIEINILVLIVILIDWFE